MINILGHHVNKMVLVSIPSVFADATPRACRLVGVEVSGLWLESADLTTALFAASDDYQARTVFVPFTQISYLVSGEAPPPVAPTSTKAPPSSPSRGVPKQSKRRH